MALPSTGQLSFSAIATELGVSTPYSLRSMSSLAGKSTPDSVGEFYGYSAAPATALLTIYGDFYQVPSVGDNFIQITDLATDTIVYEYFAPGSSSNEYLNGVNVNLIIGNNHRFNLFREDINADFAGGTTYLGLNNDSYSIDLMDYQSFDSSANFYCQSTFDSVISDSQNLYMYFTSDYT